MGRPSKKTPELIERLCELIAQGKSARAACIEVEIDQKQLWRWLADENENEFRQHYARACEQRADTHADEIIEISDDESLDPNARRIRVDARKWVASKLRPRKYGDRLDVEHGGSINLTLSREDAEL